MTTPNEQDFRDRLAMEFRKAEANGESFVEIKSGDLHGHRKVGGYPSRNHRMPACCSVMRTEMQRGDKVVQEPPKGQGATLVIRYRLPR